MGHVEGRGASAARPVCSSLSLSLSRLSRVSIGRAKPVEGWATAGKPQRCGVCEVTLAGEGVQVLASRWRGMRLSLDCGRVAAVGGASEGEGGRTEVATISHSRQRIAITRYSLQAVSVRDR